MSFLAKVLFILLLVSSTVWTEAFWWEQSKIPSIDAPTFNKLVGKGKYVFLEFYGKSCTYCEKFYPDFNRVYDYFKEGSKHHREDLLIYKIDGEEDDDLGNRYGIKTWPAFILFFPEDSTFPQKYLYAREYDVMKDYLEMLPKVQLKTAAVASSAGKSGKGSKMDNDDVDDLKADLKLV